MSAASTEGSEETHEASFDIRTASDFFHGIVIPQYEDFRADTSSSRHALLTIIFAYHFYEWVNGEKFTKERFKSTYPQDLELAKVFDVARKITNGTKHFKPRAKTRTQRGFSPGFDEGFARPLMVKFSDGSEKSANWLLREMVDFWSKHEKSGAF